MSEKEIKVETRLKDEHEVTVESSVGFVAEFRGDIVAVLKEEHETKEYSSLNEEFIGDSAVETPNKIVYIMIRNKETNTWTYRKGHRIKTDFADGDDGFNITVIDGTITEDNYREKNIGAKFADCYSKKLWSTEKLAYLEREKELKQLISSANKLFNNTQRVYLVDKLEQLGIESRICTQCGEIMIEGYCIENGDSYYCGESCLYMEMTPSEFNILYEDGNGGSYYIKNKLNKTRRVEFK